MMRTLASLAVIVGMMLAEARVSRRHEAILRARGAQEPAGDVYAWMAWLYPLAFVAMAVEGLVRAFTAIEPFVAGVLLFVVSKTLKYWAIGSLGERWTFRVLVLPGAPLVSSGPYAYVAHPNYVAVTGELLAAALMMGAPIAGVAGVAGFGTLMVMRVRLETRALREASGRLHSGAE